MFFEVAFEPPSHWRQREEYFSGAPFSLFPLSTFLSMDSALQKSSKLSQNLKAENFMKPFGTKRKVVGEGRFGLAGFLLEVRI
jgi:hypothetical protein